MLPPIFYRTSFGSPPLFVVPAASCGRFSRITELCLYNVPGMWENLDIDQPFQARHWVEFIVRLLTTCESLLKLHFVVALMKEYAGDEVKLELALELTEKAIHNTCFEALVAGRGFKKAVACVEIVFELELYRETRREFIENHPLLGMGVLKEDEGEDEHGYYSITREVEIEEGQPNASTTLQSNMASGGGDDVCEVTVEPEGLKGLLGIPHGAKGVVIFAHGSGSGRLSPRNNYVAAELRRAGLATFLLDLLTPAEEADRQNVFDISLLATRLQRATKWLASHEGTSHLAPAYFGASTGAGAAMWAAAAEASDSGSPRIRAIVSRGGRPDLAMEVLQRVQAPSLLLVGSLDGPVIGMNQRAFDTLRCEKKIIIVPGAGHLFEEPGKLDEVVQYAKNWFTSHLG